MEDEREQDGVEGGVGGSGEGFVEVVLPDFDVRAAAGAGVADHVGALVDAHRVGAAGRELGEVEAGAAAGVEDVLPSYVAEEFEDGGPVVMGVVGGSAASRAKVSANPSYGASARGTGASGQRRGSRRGRALSAPLAQGREQPVEEGTVRSASGGERGMEAADGVLLQVWGDGQVADDARVDPVVELPEPLPIRLRAGPGRGSWW
ncbi:hypothetical protein [Streptomyces erythrochromogenes]|uniref:hypothetical protein n=1 Tax=Streptomyces erythrochromogenes TaxID=285574 RepID=UPI003F620E04